MISSAVVVASASFVVIPAVNLLFARTTATIKEAIDAR